ncbi:hypothetical protein K438DRAFT_1766380 [Mycena galopus ATCC 62051]|nr:hypothetical protein K438DRAFT_1766380 [Mycena galopus ATCC 62051]
MKRTYLVEEFIEGGSDMFIKFVHNGDATPLLDADDEFYHNAEFLCFTQHLQYSKTDKAVLGGRHSKKNPMEELVLQSQWLTKIPMEDRIWSVYEAALKSKNSMMRADMKNTLRVYANDCSEFQS